MQSNLSQLSKNSSYHSSLGSAATQSFIPPAIQKLNILKNEDERGNPYLSEGFLDDQPLIPPIAMRWLEFANVGPGAERRLCVLTTTGLYVVSIALPNIEAATNFKSKSKGNGAENSSGVVNSLVISKVFELDGAFLDVCWLGRNTLLVAQKTGIYRVSFQEEGRVQLIISTPDSLDGQRAVVGCLADRLLVLDHLDVSNCL